MILVKTKLCERLNKYQKKTISLFWIIKKGLDRAINYGIKHAKGKFISIMMADMSDDIEDLKNIII